MGRDRSWDIGWSLLTSWIVTILFIAAPSLSLYSGTGLVPLGVLVFVTDGRYER